MRRRLRLWRNSIKGVCQKNCPHMQKKCNEVPGMWTLVVAEPDEKTEKSVNLRGFSYKRFNPGAVTRDIDLCEDGYEK
jgi:hypothetical protein